MSYRHARRAPSPETTDEPTEFYRDTEGSGWRKCANCNRSGIKDAFYGPNKEFCSARCSKNPLLKDDVWHHAKRRLPSNVQQQRTVSRPRPTPAPSPPPQPQQQPGQPPGKLSLTGRNLVFRNWQSLPPIRELSADPLLSDLDGIFEGATHFASVHVFPNAPLSQCWRELIHPNVLVELLHERGASQNVWFGKIEGSKGYFLKVALIGKDNKKYYFNPASINLHPVGQHKKNGNYSVPFKKYNYENMLTMVEHQFTNCNTIEKDLFSAFLDERSPVYDDVMTYEAVDWSDPSHFLTGRVLKTFGEWVYLGYDLYEGGVWVHPRSGFFRPPGWCQMVGHPIQTNHNYATNSLLSFIQNEQIQEVYCNALLLEDPTSPNPFAVGMKLEVLDPFDHVMRVGTVAKILRMGFLQIQFDHDPKCLVFYKDSVHLYPASWCSLNNLALQNSAGRQVSWEADVTFAEGESVAPPAYFPKKIASVGFNPGEVVETFNLRAPNVVSYGIILRIVGRLLLVDLLSEATPNGFLLDYESPHLYPFGYSNFMIHNNTDFRYESISAEHLDRAVQAAMRHSRELCQFWLSREAGASQTPSATALGDEPETEEEVECIAELNGNAEQQALPPNRLATAEDVLNLMKYGTREIADRERPIGWPRSTAFLDANPQVKAQLENRKMASAKPRTAVGTPQSAVLEPQRADPLPDPVSQPKSAKQLPKSAPEQPRFQGQVESEPAESSESSADVQLIAESPPKPKRVISESSTVEPSTPKQPSISAQTISQPKAAVAVKSPPKPVQTYLKSQTKPKVAPAPTPAVPKTIQPKPASTSQSTSQPQAKPKHLSFRVKGYKDLPPNMTKWTAAQVFTLISGNVSLGDSAQTLKDRAFDGLSLVALIKDPRQVRDFISVPTVALQFAAFLERLKEQYDLEQLDDWSAFE